MMSDDPTRTLKQQVQSNLFDMQATMQQLAMQLTLPADKRGEVVPLPNLIALIQQLKTKLQHHLTVAEEFAARESLIEELQAEVDKKDAKIDQVYSTLKDAEQKLIKAVFLGQQKLKSIREAEARPVCPEELMRLAHNISKGHSVAAPSNWQIGDPTRPYPTDVEMRQGWLGQTPPVVHPQPVMQPQQHQLPPVQSPTSALSSMNQRFAQHSPRTMMAMQQQHSAANMQGSSVNTNGMGLPPQQSGPGPGPSGPGTPRMSFPSAVASPINNANSASAFLGGGGRGGMMAFPAAAGITSSPANQAIGPPPPYSAHARVNTPQQPMNAQMQQVPAWAQTGMPQPGRLAFPAAAGPMRQMTPAARSMSPMIRQGTPPTPNSMARQPAQPPYQTPTNQQAAPAAPKNKTNTTTPSGTATTSGVVPDVGVMSSDSSSSSSSDSDDK